MSRHKPHAAITDGYPKVTDSRFETNLGSTFLGGEIMETSPVATRIRLRVNSQTKSYSGIRGGQRSFNFKNSYSGPNTLQTSTAESTFRELIGAKRPLVANLANVPTVKIGQYSKRNPATLFYTPG